MGVFSSFQEVEGMSCIAVIFAIPFGISCLLVPVFRCVAYKTGLLDRPNGTLKNHEKPTAYLGGVAVSVAAVLSYYFLYNAFVQSYHQGLPYCFLVPNSINSFYFLGLAILVVVGLVDDISTITPLQKLMGQVVACICFITAGLYFEEPFLSLFLPTASLTPLVVIILGKILALWWMLSITNAFNLIDIMDGLATTVALVALGGIALCNPVCCGWVMLLPLLGVLGGFLLYNRPRASIYLGDAGSLVIGGLLATLPFIFGWGHANSWATALVPVILLAIPIAELCSLMVIRTRLRIPFYHGSPHHFALYFKRRGWSVKKILRVTAVVGWVCALAACHVAFGANCFLQKVGISLVGLAFLLFIYL